MKRFLLIATALAVFGAAGCSEENPIEPTSTGDGAVETDFDAEDMQLELAPLSPVLEKHGYGHYGLARGFDTYEVTIENMTPDTGDGGAQVFSPPILATHSRGMRIFRVGGFASEEVAGVAEDAMNGPLVEKLENARRVADVVQGDGVIPPGASASYEIMTKRGMNRLSGIFMLVNTNDGFGGIDSFKLPRHGAVEIYVEAYDAGSEENSELFTEIPGPCCGSPGAGTATHERIRHHEGIRGDADLDADKWGWEGPVAKVTIRRLAPAYELRLENLTPDNGNGASQVFSPPVIAGHDRGFGIFRYGRRASEELAAIAEDAINGPMVDLLEGSPKVTSVQQGDGVIFPGTEAVYEIEGDGSRLSMAFMLVNTNDGFSGVSSLRLPAGGRIAYYLPAWDAGSEINTELMSDIPGPCCGSPEMGTPSNDRIRLHRGIRGHGDLDPDVYGWHGPAAKLTITRVR